MLLCEIANLICFNSVQLPGCITNGMLNGWKVAVIHTKNNNSKCHKNGNDAKIHVERCAALFSTGDAVHFRVSVEFSTFGVCARASVCARVCVRVSLYECVCLAGIRCSRSLFTGNTCQQTRLWCDLFIQEAQRRKSN